jgi:hypothetical protein
VQNNGDLVKGADIAAVAIITVKDGKVTDRSATLKVTRDTGKTAGISINKPKGQRTKFKAELTF